MKFLHFLSMMILHRPVIVTTCNDNVNDKVIITVTVSPQRQRSRRDDPKKY